MAERRSQPREQYLFSGPELERLGHYRAAIRAGFYTDWGPDALEVAASDPV
ncbi:MAG: hypothetical protein JOZ65_34350 [Chloroflexi bacterium]|nr:hypothetical protein [Chloroflexota bacterium]